MKIGIKNNKFFKNALILSSIMHGIGICFFLNWPTVENIRAPESKPIQITEIIFQSSVEPKVEKKVKLPTPLLESKVAKQKMPQTASLKPGKVEIVKTNPILASERLGLRRNIASSFSSSKSIRTLTVTKAVPVVANAKILPEQIRQPNDSANLIQVAERISNKLSSFSRIPKVKSSMRQFRRSSVQPVHYVQKPSISKPLLQREFVAGIPETFRRVSGINPRIRARKFFSDSNSSVNFGEPTQEESRKVRPASISRVQPVTLASMQVDIVAVSKSESVNKERGPSSVLISPEVQGNISGKEIETLTKGFASSVRAKILVAKFYPSIAQERRWEGKPVIEFQVGKNGELLSFSIAIASPYEALNQAAIEAVKKASPFPQIPDLLKLNSLKFKIPIAFALGDS